MISHVNLRIKKFLVFATAAIVYLAGQYLRGYWWPMTTWPFHCYTVFSGTASYCDRVYLGVWGWSLIAAAQMLVIIGIIMLFANRAGWRKWLKFSLFYVPIAVLIAAFAAPFSIAVVGGEQRQTDPEGWARILGVLYIFMTLGIILWSRRSTRKAPIT